MDSLKTDDQLTIVNKSKEYRVSKELIRKIPYFEKMLSHNLKESKENKVMLDFDEKAFKSFLCWVRSGNTFIRFENLVKICIIFDYFGLDNLINDCATYFHDNFSIGFIPTVIPQVTETSKVINSGALNIFICRHFLKIANTPFWLDYPIETIEYICALDLDVFSEIQVFDAIMRWVEYKSDSRKCHQERLLKLVRWCHLDDKDLSKIKENNSFKTAGFEPIFCSSENLNLDNANNRTKQNFFIIIEELDGSDLKITVLDDDFLPLVIQEIKLDESISDCFFHDEHISDVFYESGKKRIRIDWNNNKYRLLDFSANKSYQCKLADYIFRKNPAQKHVLQVQISIMPGASGYTASSLLDANDKLILFAHQIYRYLQGVDRYFNFWSTVTKREIESYFIDTENTYLETVLDDNIYILKDTLEFIKLNIDSREIKSFSFDNKNFKDLLLTSKPANDDKVILIDRSTNDISCINVNNGEWCPIGLLFNNPCSSTGDKKKSNKLLTFTSTFISMNAISPWTMNIE